MPTASVPTGSKATKSKAAKSGLLDDIDQSLNQLARLRTIPRSYLKVTERAGVQIERAAAVLLAHIQQAAPTTASHLADTTGLDSSTISRHVSLLERQALISREPHPDDARASVLSPTPEAATILDRLRRARRSILEEALHDWDDGDLRRLWDLASRLADDYSSVVLDESGRR